MFIQDIQQFVQIIKNGGVVIFPTDTVWGLGCSVESVGAIKKFYQIKKREPDKPTAVLVGSVEQAKQYGTLNPQALSLIEAHWPGALTVVVKAKENVPKEILGKESTIGLRFPDFEIVRDLCTQLSCGLVTGSANFSGNPSPMKKSELDPELLQIVDGVLDGECGSQPPSTVVDCTGDKLVLLRQGEIYV